MNARVQLSARSWNLMAVLMTVTFFVHVNGFVGKEAFRVLDSKIKSRISPAPRQPILYRQERVVARLCLASLPFQPKDDRNSVQDWTAETVLSWLTNLGVSKHWLEKLRGMDGTTLVYMVETEKIFNFAYPEMDGFLIASRVKNILQSEEEGRRKQANALKRKRVTVITHNGSKLDVVVSTQKEYEGLCKHLGGFLERIDASDEEKVQLVLGLDDLVDKATYYALDWNLDAASSKSVDIKHKINADVIYLGNRDSLVLCSENYRGLEIVVEGFQFMQNGEKAFEIDGLLIGKKAQVAVLVDVVTTATRATLASVTKNLETVRSNPLFQRIMGFDADYHAIAVLGTENPSWDLIQAVNSCKEEVILVSNRGKGYTVSASSSKIITT